MKKHTYIDLFAGCGGFSLGLYNSKLWRGLFAIEKNFDAFTTLKYNLIDKNEHFNWPRWLDINNHDINIILKKNKKKLLKLKDKVDLLVGGPPCQGFSFAGKRQEQDERNQLIHSYLEFVKIIKPKIVLFENVKGFGIGFKKHKNYRGEPYSKIVLKKLKNIGYKDATFKIIDFSKYGIPQSRKRFIIVATLMKKASNFFQLLEREKELFLNKKGLSSPVSIVQAISDLEKKHGIAETSAKTIFQYGIYHNKKLSSYQQLMREKIACKTPNSHRFPNHKVNTVNKFKDVIKNKLTSKEIRDIYKTRKTSTALLQYDRVCLTLTTLPDDYIHYREPRILTVREYARIQSFPDWYEFKGKYTTGGKLRVKECPRYTQVGNAVPPLFGEISGEVLNKILN